MKKISKRFTVVWRIFASLVGYSTSVVCDSLQGTAPSFLRSYVTSITFSVPTISLDVPIQIEMDAQSHQQSVEFLGGLYTEFFSVEFPQGLKSVFNISKRVCLDEASEEPGPSIRAESVRFVNVFPNLADFKHVGQTVVRGLQVDQWVKNTSRPGESESFYYDSKLGIPVRWVMHSRDEIFDSHRDEYVVDYISVRPLSFPIVKPLICQQESVQLMKSTQTRTAGSILHKLKHQHRTDFDKFPMGYIPQSARPNVVIYGNRVSVADLPDLKSMELPLSFDWRDYGGSPEPKDQVMCGSCYAFSVIAAIESRLRILKTESETTPVLSEQFILDCGWSDGVSSCSGGNQEDVGRVLLERYDGFVPHDDQYGRYMSTYSYCKNTTGFDGVQIDGWVSLPTRMDSESIKKFLMHYGLLSVSINAVDEIVFYQPATDGVIRTRSCRDTQLDDLNHAVNLVGFGSNEKGEYWILRNSWSKHWGDAGYFKVEMGDRDCGISLDVSFPIIHGSKPESMRPESLQTNDVIIVS